MSPICPRSWSRDHLCSTHSSKSSFLLLPFKENISRWFSEFTESGTTEYKSQHLVSLSGRPVRIPCELPDWMVLLDDSHKFSRFTHLEWNQCLQVSISVTIQVEFLHLTHKSDDNSCTLHLTHSPVSGSLTASPSSVTWDEISFDAKLGCF